ncbi:uncharacterized protein LOC126734538 isoform X2 [Anthonomus grandis grandis]|uniref:uncharacterized protein LOC126734538 isoform X2 n=1 Tax=Anthonomus grandis grandis TaxID=2921223 RepID=UPI0021660513|nr:uncharacterized protein LOC126734538 isoform X2 [Anthonomus grandis grandis]
MEDSLCGSNNCVPVVYQIFNRHSTAMSNEGDSYSEEGIQGAPNDTDADVSNLSHLDGPNESLYMISGVCVAMLLVGVIIILLAVTISKLRKREEHSNSVHPVPDATTTVVLQTTTVAATVVTTNGTTPVATAGQPQRTEPNDPLAYRGQFLWAFPPPPAERILYNNEQKNIVQTTNNDRSGFVRGFRKNLGGRWRRLVKKKPTTEIYTIPAELKPQLKQIYVY